MRRVLRPPHYDSVTALAVLRGRLYSGSRDKIIKVSLRGYIVTTDRRGMGVLYPSLRTVRLMALLQEWDLSTLHATRYAEAHNDWVMDLLSADRAGLFFSAARDGIVKVGGFIEAH